MCSVFERPVGRELAVPELNVVIVFGIIAVGPDVLVNATSYLISAGICSVLTWLLYMMPPAAAITNIAVRIAAVLIISFSIPAYSVRKLP
jgi:hypothetical protein